MTNASNEMVEYFKAIESNFDNLYSVSKEARSRGYDPFNRSEKRGVGKEGKSRW